VEEVIAEGDTVVVRWTGDATHTGALQGFPATSKVVTTSGMTTYRVAGGRIGESWHVWDAPGLLQQLGVVPPPGPGAR
jgi:predicted ester cyclase